MNSKYQKYYDKLKGKDFSSSITKYTSTLDNTKTKIGNIESTIGSSDWSEKGLEIISNSVIPSLKNQEESISAAIKSLSTVVSKCSELLTKLQNLEELCDKYANCEKEEDKNNYKNQISAVEKEIDGIINEINSISVDIKDDSVAFEGYMTDLKDTYSLEKLKAEFVGDVDDLSRYYIDPAYAHKAKELVGFDNTTGEILQRGSSIHLKPGETRVITIRLPDCTGPIDQVVRTTADGDPAYRTSNCVHGYSDVNHDPNVVEYVDYRYNKYPQQANLHTNYYDWIITADSTGAVKASQTCEYKTVSGDILKAMLTIGVIVS